MRYLITLEPLEPFMFGGDTTFGALGDKEAGSYIVKSRQFPQQTALLGMLKKELMTQEGLLTRKRRGEWVDFKNKKRAIELVGEGKFDMLSPKVQKFGVIKSISPIFLIKGDNRYIKKVDIDKFTYEDKKLKGFNPKDTDIYDNFINIDAKDKKLKSKDIFRDIEQIGNKKGGDEDSLFKKRAYLLENSFRFAFYADIDYELKDSIVTLGADRSAFRMEVREDSGELNYIDPKGYLTLIGDAYIDIDNIQDNVTFAITSEISHRNLISKKSALRKIKFEKSQTLYLYEKGSIFIDPSPKLIENLNKANLQQIGYNIYTLQGDKR